MDSRPLGIAALALGVIGAAGVGSYMALRPSQAPQAQVATANPALTETGQPAGQPGSQPASHAAKGASGDGVRPVAETEGAVSPSSKTPAAPAAQPVEASTPKSTTVAADSTSAPVPAETPRKAPKTDLLASAKRAVNTPAPARTSHLPAPVATTASRDPYASDGAYRPAGENPANPQVQPALPPQPVEQAPPPDPPAPPKPRFEDLLIPADFVIGLRLEDTVSSETARVEDRIEARVARDVRVNGEIAIPAGTRARGNVTLVEGGGKFKERARLGVRFHTLVLADGSTIPIQTETIYRDGSEVARQSATKVGAGAAAGALIGAIFGGGKGAAIGGAAGGAVGAGAAAAGPRSQATLIAGSTVTVRLSSPATVTIEK
jgi:hypothetical protein